MSTLHLARIEGAPPINLAALARVISAQRILPREICVTEGDWLALREEMSDWLWAREGHRIIYSSARVPSSNFLFMGIPIRIGGIT